MANIYPCTFGNSISHALNHLRKAKKLAEEVPEQTGRGTVLSRRVDTCYALEKRDSSWGYFVTFRMDSGEELELKAAEAYYQKLKEGTSLSITWQGENLVSFVMELG